MTKGAILEPRHGYDTCSGGAMPAISRFYGIVVYMHYNDHDPPHFHARHEGKEVLVEIETGTVRGMMSRRALKLLFEWSERHQEELRKNWTRTRQRKPLHSIPPLE